MTYPAISELTRFTSAYVECWKMKTGHEPASEQLYGIASPCIVRTENESVFWLPQPFGSEPSLANVERGVNISLREEAVSYFTSQYAGDMAARFGDLTLSLIQVWSDEDFVRLQENLIGHLVTQRRLKLSPTLFIATTDSEMEMVSLCNLTGEVVLEHFGTTKRETLAVSLDLFLEKLIPEVIFHD